MVFAKQGKGNYFSLSFTDFEKKYGKPLLRELKKEGWVKFEDIEFWID